jgi:hypothetical protein
LKASKWRKRDENKPVGNMGEGNILRNDQHKEVISSYICVLSSFTIYMMVTVTTMKATTVTNM